MAILKSLAIALLCIELFYELGDLENNAMHFFTSNPNPPNPNLSSVVLPMSVN
jgi:hypothetical protein